MILYIFLLLATILFSNASGIRTSRFDDGHHEEEAAGDIVGGVRECARLPSKDRWRHFIEISLRNRLFLNANDIQTESHRSNQRC